MNRPGRRRCAAALSVLLAAAGCGVQAEDAPREVEPPNGISYGWASETPPDPGAGPVQERLYFVRDGELVAVTRNVDAQRSVGELLDDLVAGPTDEEQRDGLTSSLLGHDIVVGVQVSGGQATVELNAALAESGRTDQILAFAQIVSTLTAKPGVTAVTFTRDGQIVGVPRADGSLSEAPATATDYATLLAGQ